MVTASAAMLEALQEAGVSYIFANFGSDHPALIEAIAEARSLGRSIPTVVTCPHEMVAMTCAHGYAQLTGRAQAVVVHVDCGTQSLGGAVHNAAKARIPVFVFAGLSPATQEGEATGSRNEFIQWIQDVPDQRGIVRQYMKYDNELRNAGNVKQIVHRSLQLAHSDPKGPVYLVGAREVMEAETQSVAIDVGEWPPIAPIPLAEAAVASLVDAFQRAARPLIVTSYVGRNPAAVAELVRFCGRLGVGVLESVPSYVNFPHNDPMYQGNHWNHPFQNRALAEADFILVVDSDVPWIPTVSKPSEGAAIAIIDVDPLKQSTPLWSIKARQGYRADAATAFAQLNARLDRVEIGEEAAERRRRHYSERHRERKADLDRREAPSDDVITPEYLTACVRRQVGLEAIALNEGITNYPAICDHMARELSGHDVRKRRRLARLDRRRGDRHETGRSGQDFRRAHRRRLLHVFRPVRRPLDGAPLPHAVSASHLQQSRLERAEIFGPRRSSGWFRQPRQGPGFELRSAAGLFRHRCCGRGRLCASGQASAGGGGGRR